MSSSITGAGSGESGKRLAYSPIPSRAMNFSEWFNKIEAFDYENDDPADHPDSPYELDDNERRGHVRYRSVYHDPYMGMSKAFPPSSWPQQRVSRQPRPKFSIAKPQPSQIGTPDIPQISQRNLLSTYRKAFTFIFGTEPESEEGKKILSQSGFDPNKPHLIDLAIAKSVNGRWDNQQLLNWRDENIAKAKNDAAARKLAKKQMRDRKLGLL